MDADRRRTDEVAADAPTNGDGQDPRGIALAPSVTHNRLDPDNWENLYVVGDVHGCIKELRGLLDRLDPGEDDLIVFVGDLVRKGPDSGAVLDLIRSSPNMRSVRGNNEEKLLRGEASCGLDSSDCAYLMSLPTCISWEETLIVHGGVDPRVPLVRQGVGTLLEMRSIPPGNGYAGPFWFESYEGPPRVFFGHTVLDEPLVTDHTVGLDTGCVYGGTLSAYDVRRDEIVSVPSVRTYRHRPDAKVVDPG